MTFRDVMRLSERYVEGRTLILILLSAAMIWGFVALAGEVLEGETHGFDTWLLLALRNPLDPADPLGPGWVEEFARDVTALGGMGILAMITLAVAGFLWIQGNRRSLFLVAAATSSGMLVSTLLKQGFDRPRPDLVPHGALVYTASFPSGHSMLSAVVYLTLAALVARVQPRRTMKVYIVAVAALLSIAIGISRVYLGVHWPTDVAAGWAAGAAWALIWWMIANRLQRHGAADPAQAEEFAEGSVGVE